MHVGQLVLRNSLRAPLRTSMTVLTVAIMLAAFVFPRTLVVEQEQFAEQAKNDRIIVLPTRGWQSVLPARYVEEIRSREGVARAVGVRWAGFRLPGKDDLFFSSSAVDAADFVAVHREIVRQLMLGEASQARLTTLQVRGVDPGVMALRPRTRIVAGRPLHSGAAEAIVGRGVLRREPGLRLGGSVRLSATRSAAVVGVFESDGTVLESEVWVDLNTTRDAFGMQGSLSSVTAWLDDPAAFEAFAKTLSADEQTGLDVLRESAYYARLSEQVATIVITLGVLQALLFSLGAICATAIVFYGAVAQRRREVGVLRALGFRRRSILAAFLLESVALSLAGGAFGMGCALLTPLLDFQLVNFATGQDVTFHFHPDLDTLWRALAVAAGVGLVGGLPPAVHAARLPVVVAMRE